MDEKSALFRALGDESHIARALNNLGTVAMELGVPSGRRICSAKVWRCIGSVGDRQGIASTLNNLAEAASRWETRRPPWDCSARATRWPSKGGNRLYAAIAMENLAALTRLQGRRIGRCPIAVPRGAASLSLCRR